MESSSTSPPSSSHPLSQLPLLLSSSSACLSSILPNHSSPHSLHPPFTHPSPLLSSISPKLFFSFLPLYSPTPLSSSTFCSFLSPPPFSSPSSFLSSSFLSSSFLSSSFLSSSLLSSSPPSSPSSSSSSRFNAAARASGPRCLQHFRKVTFVVEPLAGVFIAYESFRASSPSH